MMKISIIIIIICACAGAHAQINLVRNASFEQYDTCPSNYDQVKYAYYWSCIDTNYNPDDTLARGYCAPDYVNTCGSSILTSVPSNYHFTNIYVQGMG